MKYSAISLTDESNTILVEAGQGCMRGGQGSNGSMWLIRFSGTRPDLISPSEFEGRLYAVQPAKSHGYHDIVLGWHNSAFETDLRYFRFDGTVYRPVSSALRIADFATGVLKITPTTN